MIPQQRIIDITTYFQKVNLPQYLQLNECTFIFDLQKNIEVNLLRLKDTKNEYMQQLYFDKLVEIYKKLK